MTRTLTTCVRDLNNTYLTPIEVDIDAPVHVDEERHLVIVRMVGEATVNACKHANASRLQVTGNIEKAVLCVTVVDDGCGFDYDQTGTFRSGKCGMGLPLMQERARSVGGNMLVSSAPGNGTTIKLWKPLSGDCSLASAA